MNYIFLVFEPWEATCKTKTTFRRSFGRLGAVSVVYAEIGPSR